MYRVTPDRPWFFVPTGTRTDSSGQWIDPWDFWDRHPCPLFQNEGRGKGTTVEIGYPLEENGGYCRVNHCLCFLNRFWGILPGDFSLDVLFVLGNWRNGVEKGNFGLFDRHSFFLSSLRVLFEY